VHPIEGLNQLKEIIEAHRIMQGVAILNGTIQMEPGYGKALAWVDGEIDDLKEKLKTDEDDDA